MNRKDLFESLVECVCDVGLGLLLLAVGLRALLDDVPFMRN